MRCIAVSLPFALALACADPTPTTTTPDESPAAAEAEAEGPEPAPAPEDPSAASHCELGEDWTACAGQTVVVSGQAPQTVMQHPSIAQPEGLSPDGRNSFQGYVDVDDSKQLIVLTAAPFQCAGAMTVSGTLEPVDLGGDPNTKGGYSGWSIVDAEVSCE